MNELCGQVLLDKYQVIQQLGAGGFGAVYLAQDLLTRRDVALKILHPHVLSHSNTVQRFKNEAQALARLEHPNIVALYTMEKLGEHGLCLVLKYLEGEPLNEYVRAHTPGLELRLDLAIQICRGLEAAHGCDVLHRDLKPANILVSTHGEERRAVLLDFGIARLNGSPELTSPGQPVGTPRYMAPEQINDGTDIDARADIYSLGAVLYELIAGQAPFTGADAKVVMYKHLQVPPPAFAELPEPVEVPERLEALVIWMLEKSRDDRPSSVAEVRQRLEAVRLELTKEAGVTPVNSDPELALDLAKARDQRPLVIALLFGAVLLGGGLWAALGGECEMLPVQPLKPSSAQAPAMIEAPAELSAQTMDAGGAPAEPPLAQQKAPSRPKAKKLAPSKARPQPGPPTDIKPKPSACPIGFDCSSLGPG